MMNPCRALPWSFWSFGALGTEATLPVFEGDAVGAGNDFQLPVYRCLRCAFPKPHLLVVAQVVAGDIYGPPAPELREEVLNLRCRCPQGLLPAQTHSLNLVGQKLAHLDSPLARADEVSQPRLIVANLLNPTGKESFGNCSCRRFARTPRFPSSPVSSARSSRCAKFRFRSRSLPSPLHLTDSYRSGGVAAACQFLVSSSEGVSLAGLTSAIRKSSRCRGQPIRGDRQVLG